MSRGLLFGGRVLAAVLILVGGYIHLKLYFDGYRDIPDANLGRSFLLNAAAALVVAVALVVWRPVWSLVAGTILGYAPLIDLGLSRTSRGIFGFTESGFKPSPEATISVIVEIGAAIVLIALLYLELRDSAPAPQPAFG